MNARSSTATAISLRLAAGIAVGAAQALLLPGAGAQPSGDAADRRLERVLRATPLVDGHNDLPWEIRDKYGSQGLDLARSTAELASPLQTDLPRMRRGRIGAQFWSVWIPVTVTGPAAVKMTLEQIDVVRNMAAAYPGALEMATTAADIRRIHKAGRIASLIGVEGGHQIGESLAVLRQYQALGVRYMTLTHSAHTSWADSATADPLHRGLTPIGREVVREMNRLGMLVDLSHVSAETMKAAIAISAAPVIFSHSNARALMDHPRNVPDDVLRLLRSRGGVVMVNFYPGYISNAYNRWDADRAAELARINNPPLGGLYIGQPERARAAMAAWDAAHPRPVVTIGEVADHIDHIAKVAGIDHVGLGSDFDGIPATVKGLESVDRFPALFRELIHRGWSDSDLEKLAGRNLLRVMEAAERVSARLSAQLPAETLTAPGAAGTINKPGGGH